MLRRELGVFDGAREPTVAKHLNVMLSAGAELRGGAVAESRLDDENAVRVYDVDVAHSTYGVGTDVRAMAAKIHHQSNVGKCCLRPKIPRSSAVKKQSQYTA